MKKHFNRTLIFAFVFALFLAVGLSGTAAQAQTDVVIKPNPQNPQRKIIELPDVPSQARVLRLQQNVLDSSGFRGTPKPFQRFEMIHPSTGKALNPNAQLKLTLPDGKVRTTTVKQFYDEVNALEMELSKRGRSLRDKETFARVRPSFDLKPYLKPPMQNSGGTVQAGGNLGGNLGTNPNLNVAFEVDSRLYISASTPDSGTPEFPAKWVQQSTPSQGRRKFAFLVEVDKGIDQLIKKFDWQISTNPFNVLKLPGAKKDPSGQAVTTGWSVGYNGVSQLKFKGKMYNYFVIDFGAIPGFDPEPAGASKNYFVRVIPYGADGKALKPSTLVVARYGAKVETLEVHAQSTDSEKDFNLDFPSDSFSPFSIYVRGQGFQMVKSYKTTEAGAVPLGFKMTAGASLGMRYFNFVSLVDDSAPKTYEQDLFGLGFSAIAGTETGPGSTTESSGVGLSLSLLGMPWKNIAITKDVPSGSSIPLAYDFKKSLDKTLCDVRFSIGPVPMRVLAELKGEAGVKVSGVVDANSLNISGTINPYVHTAFIASGGVDAVFAYAKLQASVEPLFNAEFNLKFDSNNKSSDLITLTKSFKTLHGKVSLVAGFYYPCPNLKKIAGFITGDEDLPLCEQQWRYDIFEFGGWDFPQN